MSDVSTGSTSTSRHGWLILLVANLTLGLTLWFFHCTDYSLAGTIPDLLFPPAVAVMGLVSIMAAKGAPTLAKKLVIGLSSLPSLVGGCLPLLVGMLLFVPPLTLGGMFMVHEIANEKLIQQAISPDGWRSAEVYFRGVGAYGAGSGRIFVRVKHRLFPFVERDVYYLPVTHVPRDTTNRLHWRDNETLHIAETGEEVEVGLLTFQVPQVFTIPFSVCGYLTQLESERRANLALATPVRAMPAYPAYVTHDVTRFDDWYDTAFRSFNIPDHTADEVAEWYQQALSQPPWYVVHVDRQVVQAAQSDLGNTEVSYCIQAKLDEGAGQERMYYLEVMWHSGNPVHVNIGTPLPITEICERHVNEE
ncbi:MAG: hypothetical protein GTO63_11080 [Anaerolineae bacterium]|nr:hypothetical protein [Anaerolineae bacterium]NIN95416.1 hypothetical protein [Anaerolineae bacterium]NIQ78394.1 hypothetical protein [Anaerolineae bacterium]